MNKRIVPFLCLIMFGVLFFPGNFLQNVQVRAAGTQLFVSPDGSGTACSQSAPCLPAQAMANANDHDVVYFEGGVYPAPTDPFLTISKSFSLYGGWDGVGTGDIVINPEVYPTTLDGEGQVALIKVNDQSLVDTITINGFRLINGYAETPGAYTWGGAIFVDEGEVLIENNEFVDNFAGDYGGAIYINNYQNSHVVGNYFLGNWAEYGGGAIFVSLTDPDSTSVTIEANIFSGGTASYGSAVSVSNSEILFTNNIVKDTLGVSALDLSSSGPPSIISNNYIIRPAQNGLEFGGITDTPYQIWNNTIVGANNGIVSYSEVKTNSVNNIIVDSTYSIKTFGGVLSGSNNLFYMNSHDDNLLTNPIVGQDPLFVDGDNDDYHIQMGSPAQDAGIAVSLSFDFDYDDRPIGDGFDIGADEIAGGYSIFLPLITK